MTELDSRSAFDFYQSVAHRLPNPKPTSRLRPSQSAAARSRHAADLLAIAHNFDVFVFDAYGVLNVGHTAIAGAADCIAQLREWDKQVFVLTNGASLPLSAMSQKFTQFGFDFAAEEIVSSRLAAERAAVTASAEPPLWGAITASMSSPADLPIDAIEVNDDPDDYRRVGAFLFLSSGQWSASRQQLLIESLQANPRPLIVANPDVVAPSESGFTLEPGYFVHKLMDEFDQAGVSLDVAFHGKPFPSVFREVLRRIKGNVPRPRIAMMGDTLHTDILGAQAQGWSSVLVSERGLFRGLDVQTFIDESHIHPDWIIPSIL